MRTVRRINNRLFSVTNLAYHWVTFEQKQFFIFCPWTWGHFSGECDGVSEREDARCEWDASVSWSRPASLSGPLIRIKGGASTVCWLPWSLSNLIRLSIEKVEIYWRIKIKRNLIVSITNSVCSIAWNKTFICVFQLGNWMFVYRSVKQINYL